MANRSGALDRGLRGGRGGRYRGAANGTPGAFKAWLEGQRTLLGKLITDAQIKPG